MTASREARAPAAHSLGELAQFVQAELQGDAELSISGLATLENAGANQLSFLANPQYRKFLKGSEAGAVLIRSDMADAFEGNKLIVANPYLAYAKLTALFAERFDGPAGIHPTAVVAESAVVDASASLGPHVVVEEGAEIEADVVLSAGCFVGAYSRIGRGSRLMPQVNIYHGVSIGENCLFHSQAVVGSDGFGFAPGAEAWVKIHQLGGVQIGDNVELGACTTIDRGALDDTVLGKGVIIDNLVQIAHNVRIGEQTAIAANSAIAGSTHVGARCTFGGGVGVVGHLHIADDVHVSAHTLVTKSLKRPGSYSSGTPVEDSASWRKNAVRYKQLDELVARVKELEQLIASKDRGDNN